MSFQDSQRRRRQPRSPALGQYGDDPSAYQGAHANGRERGRRDSYQGFAGLTDTPRQRPPWEDPNAPPAWDTRDTPAQETSWDLGALQAEGGKPRRTSGGFRGILEGDEGQSLLAGSGDGRRRADRPHSRGLLPGALVGFLAAAVAIGVANLVAAFVRPQASPIIAVGGAFIDRTPNALKEFAIQRFGENDKNMLLLGMYVTIGFIAIVIGMLAWQRMWIGVAGIGLFGLFGAFVALTRPESHVSDVIPSIVGGVVGIAAIVLLINAGMPRARAAWARGR